MSRAGRILIALAALILITIGVLVGYAKSRGFSAKAQPSKVEELIAGSLLSLSYPASAKSTPNPVQATPENLSRGRDHFAHDCAVCHGNDGAGHTEVAAGLYPKVPNLRDESDMTDGELFYIIRNGIRFTGMPGWNDPDEEVWKMVLFIRNLPHETPEDLNAMNARNHLGGQH
jgi:mono/diheme cytochrome c family protein